jgi:hypothetical protein
MFFKRAVPYENTGKSSGMCVARNAVEKDSTNQGIVKRKAPHSPKKMVGKPRRRRGTWLTRATFTRKDIGTHLRVA